jgi:hypothetical protein
MPREMHHLHSAAALDRKPILMYLENYAKLRELEDESCIYSIHSYYLEN